MCLLSLTNETEIQKKKTVHCLTGKLLNFEAENQRAFAKRGRGCFPGFFPLQTDHPLLLYHCGGRYKKYKIGFSTNISQEFEDKQPYQPITRKKLCFINYICMSLRVQYAACKGVTSGQTHSTLDEVLENMRQSTTTCFGFGFLLVFFLVSPLL